MSFDKKIETRKVQSVSALKPSFFTKLQTYKNTPLVVLFGKVVRKLFRLSVETIYLPPLRPEFKCFKLASHALQKCLDDLEFSSVLDVGSGEGLHASCFVTHNKNVSVIDFGESIYFKNRDSSVKAIIHDFNTYSFEGQFDLVWCSHVLEHQLNANLFLKKIYDVVALDGWLAITVPPSRTTIVGGHVTNWNAGLLIYNLVLAGFDCCEAKVLQYGYNISVIVKKTSRTPTLENLSFDAGD